MYHGDTTQSMTDPTHKSLSPREATERIRAAVSEGCEPDISWTRHVKERLAERSLMMGDVLHVCRFGYVYEQGEPSTMPGLFKYKIEGTSPNSGSRSLRVVVIPSQANHLKLVTIMWVDEKR